MNNLNSVLVEGTIKTFSFANNNANFEIETIRQVRNEKHTYMFAVEAVGALAKNVKNHYKNNKKNVRVVGHLEAGHNKVWVKAENVEYKQ